MCLQFKHVPLYLEWAPLGVFSGKPEEKQAEEMETTETAKDDKVLLCCCVFLCFFITIFMYAANENTHVHFLWVKFTKT